MKRLAQIRMKAVLPTLIGIGAAFILSIRPAFQRKKCNPAQ
jgi:hypothetical protein